MIGLTKSQTWGKVETQFPQFTYEDLFFKKFGHHAFKETVPNDFITFCSSVESASIRSKTFSKPKT